MSEDFLHYIWRFQLFNQMALKLSNGEELAILKPGLWNKDAGPDFFNALIKIGRTKWAGNIEIHINASDWNKHGHQNDEAYDKVILHVVWKNDQVLKRSDGSDIPTLVLSGKIKKTLLERFDDLLGESSSIPCHAFLEEIETQTLRMQLDRMMLERLEIKSKRIQQLLKFHQGDWESTLYQLLGKYFGFKVNAVPFELLTTSLPLKVIRKHRSSIMDLEALLFGQAGMLDEASKSNYALELKKIHDYLKLKYELQSMKSSWKYSRLRPTNFPSIRIAQFAQLWFKHENLFQKLVNANNVEELLELFQLQVSNYWEFHYRFEVIAQRKGKKRIGKNSIYSLIINVVVPIVFTYGEHSLNSKLKEKAMAWLENLPAEQNKILREWNKYNLNAENAADSQGFIQLKTAHCENKNCLNCAIGNSILKLSQ